MSLMDRFCGNLGEGVRPDELDLLVSMSLIVRMMFQWGTERVGQAMRLEESRHDSKRRLFETVTQVVEDDDLRRKIGECS
jgi:hypothetical protein